MQTYKRNNGNTDHQIPVIYVYVCVSVCVQQVLGELGVDMRINFKKGGLLKTTSNNALIIYRLDSLCHSRLINLLLDLKKRLLNPLNKHPAHCCHVRSIVQSTLYHLKHQAGDIFSLLFSKGPIQRLKPTTNNKHLLILCIQNVVQLIPLCHKAPLFKNYYKHISKIHDSSLQKYRVCRLSKKRIKNK